MGSGLYCLYHINRYRGLGIEQDHWLGLGYHKLCLVGRYWSRRYSYFSGTIALPSKMENGRKPFRRSNDNFCSNTSRTFPDYSHGAAMVGILGAATSKPVWIALGKL